MATISTVIWTFTVSLIMFCLNSSKVKTCGISYNKLFVIWAKSHRILKIAFLKNVSIINILMLLTIILIFGTAWYSFEECEIGIICIIVIQLFVLTIFVHILSQIVSPNKVEKMVEKYIKNYFIVKIEGKDIISSWDRLFVAEAFEMAEYSAEERNTMECWIGTLDEIIQAALKNQDEFYMIAMYRRILESIIVKDERFNNRWGYVFDSFVMIHDKRVKTDELDKVKTKAVVVYLVDNADVLEDTYLNELLDRFYLQYAADGSNDAGFEVPLFAVIYNRALSRTQDWRKYFYYNNEIKVARYLNIDTTCNLDDLLVNDINNVANNLNIKLKRDW